MNTYPLVHYNVFSATLYGIVLTPLIERFEAEHGTLLTGALFFGRMRHEVGLEESSFAEGNTALSTLPAVFYLLLERGLLRGNNAIQGARHA